MGRVVYIVPHFVNFPFVVDGFIPINNVDALSSFIGAYDREIDE
jgi:hypothetical protein